VLGHFDIAGHSDVGRVRQNNQDSILVDARLGLFVLADGVGGGPGGELASQITVQTVYEVMRQELDNRWYRFWGRADQARLGVMESAVLSAHLAVSEFIEQNPELRGMASTVVVGVLGVGRCLCVAVGDSRLYHLGDDGLIQVTEDQTLANKLVADGYIPPDDPRVDQYSHVLTHAVGSEEALEVQKWVVPMRAGDMVLACSDGLNDMVADAEIANLAVQGDSLERSVGLLVDAANGAGGRDNVSVIVATTSERALLPLCG